MLSHDRSPRYEENKFSSPILCRTYCDLQIEDSSAHDICREESQDVSADTVKECLQMHRNHVIASDLESNQRINVLHSQVFRDGIYAYGRPSFDTTKYLKVRFNGEPATD